MGGKTRSFVRKIRRRGETRVIIDIRVGGNSIYKRDAKIQCLDSAEREAAERWRIYLNEGTPLLPEERAVKLQTVQSFVDKHFRPIYMPTAYTPGSRRAYESHLKDIMSHYGSLRFDQITQAHHQAFAKRLLGRGIQTRKHLALVRTVLRQAEATSHCSVVPPLPALPKQPYREIDLPSDEAVAACIREASGYLKPAIVLGACFGDRKNEARAHRIGDIDLGGGWVTVRKSFSAGLLKAPKSGHERRVRIYPELFGPEALDFLDAACRGRGRHEHVLRAPHGGVPCERSIDDALHRVQRKLGLPEFRYHCFRHWFCTTLLRNRVNIEAVRRMMGHSSLAVTQRYLHLVGTDYDPAPTASPVLGQHQPRTIPS